MAVIFSSKTANSVITSLVNIEIGSNKEGQIKKKETQKYERER